MDSLVLVGGIALIVDAVLLAVALVVWTWSLVDTARLNRERPETPRDIAEDELEDTPVPYDPVFMQTEQEKVDTASIKLVEVPADAREETVVITAIRVGNTGKTINPKNPEACQFYEPNTSVYFLKKEDSGKVIAAQSWGQHTLSLGDRRELTLVTSAGDRDGGVVTVVGVLHSVDDTSFTEEVKTVPFYVFK